MNCPHCGKDVGELFKEHGRAGGSKTSEAKRAAARKNGRRPKTKRALTAPLHPNGAGSTELSPKDPPSYTSEGAGAAIGDETLNALAQQSKLPNPPDEKIIAPEGSQVASRTAGSHERTANLVRGELAPADVELAHDAARKNTQPSKNKGAHKGGTAAKVRKPA